MAKSISGVERQIRRVKNELMELGDFRPGSLSEQYNVCGNPKCRCKEDPPKKHGPYYLLSYNRGGKSSSKFVKKEHAAAVKQQLKNYKKMRNLVDKWIDLSAELSNLRLEKQ